ERFLCLADGGDGDGGGGPAGDGGDGDGDGGDGDGGDGDDGDEGDDDEGVDAAFGAESSFGGKGGFEGFGEGVAGAAVAGAAGAGFGAAMAAAVAADVAGAVDQTDGPVGRGPDTVDAVAPAAVESPTDTPDPTGRSAADEGLDPDTPAAPDAPEFTFDFDPFAPVEIAYDLIAFSPKGLQAMVNIGVTFGAKFGIGPFGVAVNTNNWTIGPNAGQQTFSVTVAAFGFAVQGQSDAYGNYGVVGGLGGVAGIGVVGVSGIAGVGYDSQHGVVGVVGVSAEVEGVGFVAEGTVFGGHPVILDLDGNGITITQLTSSNFYFDIA